MAIGSAIAKIFPTSVIILLVTTLSLLLFSYESRHQSLLLEGNKLYSAEAAFVDADSGSVLDALHKLGLDARAFSLSAHYGNVRIVAAHDYEQIPFPVHQGIGLSNSERKEALVGADVPTECINGKDYIVLNGISYEVVGLLGTKPNSVLQEEILIKDDELFRYMEASAIVLDGKDAATSYLTLMPGASIEAFGFGIDKRTSIDSISPLLFAAGFVLSIAGFICAGLFYGQQKVNEIRILSLIGFARMRCYFSQAILLVVICGISLVCSTLISVVIAPEQPPTSVVLVVTGFVSIILVGTSSMVPVLTKGRV